MASDESEVFTFKFSVAHMGVGNFVRVKPISISKRKENFITCKEVRKYLEHLLGYDVVIYQHTGFVKEKPVVDIHCCFKFASEDGTVYPVSQVRRVLLKSLGDSTVIPLAGDRPCMLLIESVEEALETFEIFTHIR